MKTTPRLLAIFLMALVSTASGAETDDLLAKANGGDAAAQYDIGQKYAKGDGVAKNMEEAVKWLTKSAEQGNADAQMSLGALYVSGRGVPKNSTEAAKWYRLAAEQGRPAAQVQMARMHLAGAGVVKDDVEAAKWASLAQTQGEGQANRILVLVRSRMTAEETARSEALVRDFTGKKTTDDAASGVPLVAPPLESAE
jgi:TPR repeat protein